MRFVVCIFCLLFSVASFGEDFFANDSIQKINQKMGSINSVMVKFRQKYQDKSDEGVIYYKEGQGLFVKYDTSPVAILVNKSTVTYFDSKLDQKSQIPTEKSASQIFIKKLILTSEDFSIKSIKDLEGAIIVTAKSKKVEDEGTFTMYFSKEDNTLRRLDIESPNPEQGSVRIDLYSHSYANISNDRFKAINIGKNL